ncbi:MAG TPA: universal stress protein, partial [Pseudonocardia sp.]
MITPRQDTVVVGVDGSTAALDAVRWGVDEAARRGGGLRLVHAIAVPTTDQPPGPAPRTRP